MSITKARESKTFYISTILDMPFLYILHIPLLLFQSTSRVFFGQNLLKVGKHYGKPRFCADLAGTRGQNDRFRDFSHTGKGDRFPRRSYLAPRNDRYFLFCRWSFVGQGFYSCRKPAVRTKRQKLKPLPYGVVIGAKQSAATGDS